MPKPSIATKVQIPSQQNTRSSSRRTAKPPDYFQPGFERQVDDAEPEERKQQQENGARSAALKQDLSEPAIGETSKKNYKQSSLLKSPRTKRMLPAPAPSHSGASMALSKANGNSDTDSRPHSIPTVSLEKQRHAGTEDTVESKKAMEDASPTKKRKKSRIRVVPISLQPKKKQKIIEQQNFSEVVANATIQTPSSSERASKKANTNLKVQDLSSPSSQRNASPSPPRLNKKSPSTSTTTHKAKPIIVSSEPTSPLVLSTSPRMTALKLHAATTTSKSVSSCPTSKRRSISPRRQSLLSATSVLELNFDEQARIISDAGVNMDFTNKKISKSKIKAKKEKGAQEHAALADSSTTKTRKDKGVKRKRKQQQQHDEAPIEDRTVPAPKKHRKTRSDKGVSRKPRSSAPPVGSATATAKPKRKPRSNKGVPHDPSMNIPQKVVNKGNSDVKAAIRSKADEAKKGSVEYTIATDDAKAIPTELGNQTSIKPKEPTDKHTNTTPASKPGRKPRKDKGVPRGPRKSKDSIDHDSADQEKESVFKKPEKPTRKARKDKDVSWDPRVKRDSKATRHVSVTKRAESQPTATSGNKGRKTRRDQGVKRRAVGYYSGTRCGDCLGCRVIQNCGKCIPCLDMPEFGGPGKMRKLCILRKCLKSSRAAGRKNDNGAVASSSKKQCQEAVTIEEHVGEADQKESELNADDSSTESGSLSDNDAAYVEEMSDMEWDDNRPDPVPIMKAATRSCQNGPRWLSSPLNRTTQVPTERTTRASSGRHASKNKLEPEAVHAAELARRLQEKQRAEMSRYDDEEDSDADDDDNDDSLIPPPPLHC